MEALIKKDISKLTIDNIENINEVYELNVDDLKVGYCIINKNPEDQIKLFIDEDYRSNGYGKLFFKKVLDTFNTDVFVATNNRHMINIIESNNGKELYRKDGMNYYVIPKGN
jgi:GNAT superfamily N-acetyltransferase